MIRQFRVFVCAAIACSALAMFVARAEAVIYGYGVNANQQLFRFDVEAPGPIPIDEIGGPLPFLPEGIDFRPSTNTLYAIDVGALTTQLYTIDSHTGTSAPVGDGFPTSVAGSYDLSGSQQFGFDFNPKTLQDDDSMRIRLVSNNFRQNLRLNSSTGEVANVDTLLVIQPSGDLPFTDAVAYINNIAQKPVDGTTVLYDMDVRNNSLYTQNPPNNGALNLVGAFGAGIMNTQSGMHFDVYTDPASVDATIGGDTGYAVLKRPDAPIGGPLGTYLLYNVNLASGEILNGKRVGTLITPADFTGGFAVNPIPEPSTVVLAMLALATLCRTRRRGV